MLRHLIALGIKHETATDNVLEGYGIEDHRGNGMKRKEPAACLVDTFVDEVAGESNTLVDEFGVFKRIVYLSIRHGT